MKYSVEIAGKIVDIEFEQSGDNLRATIDGNTYEALSFQSEENTYTFIIANQVFEFRVERRSGENELMVYASSEEIPVKIIDRKKRKDSHAVSASGTQAITATMPGRVVQILKAVGDAVNMGESVLVVEAMKMQNELASPKTGTITSIKAQSGQTVTAGEVLAIVE